MRTKTTTERLRAKGAQHFIPATGHRFSVIGIWCAARPHDRPIDEQVEIVATELKIDFKITLTIEFHLLV